MRGDAQELRVTLQQNAQPHIGRYAQGPAFHLVDECGVEPAGGHHPQQRVGGHLDMNRRLGLRKAVTQ